MLISGRYWTIGYLTRCL